MARPKAPQREALRTYYVYDDGIGDNLGQVPLKQLG